MDVLLVCKPSGRNAMAIFLILASFVALSVIWAYEGIEDPVCLWMLLLSVPMTVLFFFLFRFQFVGEEQLGIDGKDFVIHVVKKFPFQKDLRIPLADIAEIRYNSKSKMREIRKQWLNSEAGLLMRMASCWSPYMEKDIVLART